MNFGVKNFTERNDPKRTLMLECYYLMYLMVILYISWNEICNFLRLISNQVNLTSKGLGLPYVGFSDFGQADVNAIIFLIF